MRKLFIIPAVFITVLISCNSGANDKKDATDSTNIATSTQNVADAAVTPLPAIPAGAKVYFENLKNGETVSSPLKIEFGVDKMTVTKKAPIGKIAEGVGHHHLLIDAGDSIPAGTIIPDDSTHIHYGGGQTSATINLAPGKHTLTLQFGDAIHRSYGSALAATVTVNVK